MGPSKGGPKCRMSHLRNVLHQYFCNIHVYFKKGLMLCVKFKEWPVLGH